MHRFIACASVMLSKRPASKRWTSFSFVPRLPPATRDSVAIFDHGEAPRLGHEEH